MHSTLPEIPKTLKIPSSSFTPILLDLLSFHYDAKISLQLQQFLTLTFQSTINISHVKIQSIAITFYLVQIPPTLLTHYAM